MVAHTEEKYPFFSLYIDSSEKKQMAKLPAVLSKRSVHGKETESDDGRKQLL